MQTRDMSHDVNFSAFAANVLRYILDAFMFCTRVKRRTLTHKHLVVPLVLWALRFQLLMLATAYSLLQFTHKLLLDSAQVCVSL